MASDESQDGPETAQDRLRAVWDLYEDSPSIGDFHLTKGFGPKPIDFGGPLQFSEPLTGHGLRMWQDYLWSQRIAPTPVSPIAVTGI